MANEQRRLLENDVESEETQDQHILPEEESLEHRFAGHSNLIGTAGAILAGITFTSANVIQKYTPNLNFWDLLFVRAVSQLTIIGGFSFWFGHNPIGPSGSRSRIYMQGILGGILLLCLFIAVKHIALGDASAIFFSAPFFTMLFSSCMLNEHFGLFRVAVSGIIITGVILLCRPPAIFPPESLPEATALPENDAIVNQQTLIGTCCALSVPVLSAIITILNRQCRHVPFLVLTFWFGVGALFVSFIGMNIPFLHSSNVYSGNIYNFTTTEWIYTSSIVALGIIGNIIMTIALKLITPARAMVFRSFEVIANYILQATLFSKVSVSFHITDPLGAFLIVMSVLLMGFEISIKKKYSWKYL
uniref:Transmembrane protein 20 n=2 Tax=Caligus rogercresseyi TaxID=217165 RepID=C1BR55_CALRO|nr:Transmembrane protein 20 [Caligus rogercresseyi]